MSLVRSGAFRAVLVPRRSAGLCDKCHVMHDPSRCQAHVDVSRRAAYAAGGRAARAVASGPLRQCRRRLGDQATVCQKHGGGAGQVRAATAVRRSLAEALETTDARAPHEVLASALHRVDVVGQHTQAMIAAREPVTPEMIEALLDSIRTQVAVAKVALDANIDQRREAEGQRVVDLVTRLLDWVGVSAIPELSARIGDAVPMLLRGQPVVESALLSEAVEARAKARVERELPRAVEAELARRGVVGSPLAIGSSAAADVSGPEGPSAGGGGVGDRFGQIFGQRGVQRAGDGSESEAAAAAGAGEVVDAVVVDELPSGELSGRDPRRCPACAQDRFAAGHDAVCGWNEVASRMSLYSPLLGR